uniref:TetR/AcrR family transcriptional regulator n=1 Tax=uncultured Rhizobium sp. TaxID=155567 RepID=UPI00260768A4|nr:TetR/AcrR family transcriptional regulator [uncultured Rhizobium sp.]
MKVSREQMAENRRRILDVASRLFKDKGFDAVSVAEVMKAAGMTHGGFYGHFASKDDLVAQTLAHALEGDAVGDGDFSGFVRSYLAPRHRDNAGNGCPTAGLAAAVRHQTPAAKAAMTEGLRSQIARMEKALPQQGAPDKRRAAIGSWAAMVGAVILARAVDDPELSDEVLGETRAWIDAMWASPLRVDGSGKL